MKICIKTYTYNPKNTNRYVSIEREREVKGGGAYVIKEKEANGPWQCLSWEESERME